MHFNHHHLLKMLSLVKYIIHVYSDAEGVEFNLFDQTAFI